MLTYMATKPPRTSVLSPAKGRILLLLFFLLLLYVVVPRIGNFSESFDVLETARPVFIAAACGFLLMTYLLAAGMYYLLAFKPLTFGRTLVVQTASGFANRVLPAGLGVITLYVQYLRKSGHSLPQAIAVSGANNLLGIGLHMMLVGVAFVISPGALFGQLSLSQPGRVWLILGGVAVVIAINLVVFARLRRYVFGLGKEVFGSIALYRKRPGRLAGAALCSCLLTLSHVLIFYMSALALDINVAAVQAFIIFTIGIVAATVTPTPGGLVGAEAGLTAGLVVYGVEAPTALAAALLYRFLTYWLPLLPGFVVFISNRRLYL